MQSLEFALASTTGLIHNVKLTGITESETVFHGSVDNRFCSSVVLLCGVAKPSTGCHMEFDGGSNTLRVVRILFVTCARCLLIWRERDGLLFRDPLSGIFVGNDGRTEHTDGDAHWCETACDA